MKKRLISILLTLCMLFCLVPTGVFAEGETATGSAAIQLGTDALSKNVNTATAPTVYFGQDHENNPGAWRVIDYDGNSAAGTAGNMTLLSAGNMGVVQFDDDGVNNEYAPSDLKIAIDALAEKLTTEENAAVKKRTLTSGSYNGENTDCVAGAQVDNAVFWPLSTAEASAVNKDLRIVDKEHPTWDSSNWWLRSPGEEDYIDGIPSAVVRGGGGVLYFGINVTRWYGVRPAFSLKSSSVLFTSAAVGGKPDGGLTPISEYTGNEWKLTLSDSDRSGFLATLKSHSGNSVRFDYKGAKTDANEYISAMVINGETVKYYGRLKNVSETGMENGNLTLTLPVAVDVEKGDRLFVFNEQCNGDCKTDYASDLLELPLKSVGSNTPRLRINAESNEWEVSYDEGQTWTSLGVKATGEKGDKGDKGDPGQDGAPGKDGITPRLKIGNDNIWYVSYDGGQTWVSLGVKATGSDGKDGKDGTNGQDGKDGDKGDNGDKGDKGDAGKDGRDGTNGVNGSDGKDGKDGIGIVKAEINADGELVLTYTDGKAVNLGKVVGADGKDDGLTPFIGENGNWWIGEKDTGVKAAADATIPAGSGNISESAASPALIAVGIVAGIALLGNLGLVLYIVLKKKNSLV